MLYMVKNDFNFRYCSRVLANDTAESTYTIPPGTNIYVTTYAGSATYNGNIKVEIFWDNILVFVTHGDLLLNGCNCMLEGNGQKQIKIKFTNDSSNDETCGGYVLGVKQYV